MLSLSTILEPYRQGSSEVPALFPLLGHLPQSLAFSRLPRDSALIPLLSTAVTACSISWGPSPTPSYLKLVVVWPSFFSFPSSFLSLKISMKPIYTLREQSTGTNLQSSCRSLCYKHTFCGRSINSHVPTSPANLWRIKLVCLLLFKRLAFSASTAFTRVAAYCIHMTVGMS